MKFTAQQIAELLHGEVEGDQHIEVHDFAKIEEGRPGCLSFLANPKYTHYIYDTASSIVLVNRDFVPQKKVHATLVRVDDAYKAIALLLDHYNRLSESPQGIEKQSFIHKSAKVGKKAYIGAFAYVGKNCVVGDNVRLYPGVYLGNDVEIGDNTTLYAGVKVYRDCKIGRNCIVHAGTVIGADGFGFAPNGNDTFLKIGQIGNVVIEDNVELGALVTIDRATMGSTIIREGVKLDNQNHVAHNVEIGRHTVIAAQSGIAGTVKIGQNCMFGGQIGIGPHVKIADGTKLSAQSGVTNTVKHDNSIMMGSPAYDLREYLRNYVHFKNLNDIVARLEKIEKILNQQL